MEMVWEFEEIEFDEVRLTEVSCAAVYGYLIGSLTSHDFSSPLFLGRPRPPQPIRLTQLLSQSLFLLELIFV